MVGLNHGKLFDRNQEFADGGEVKMITAGEAGSRQGDVQIVKRGTTDNATITLYTVPADKRLYVTSAYCQVTTAAAIEGYIQVVLNTVTSIVLSVRGSVDISAGLAILSTAFTMPIKLNATDTVQLRSTGPGGVAGGFTGWIEDV